MNKYNVGKDHLYINNLLNYIYKLIIGGKLYR